MNEKEFIEKFEKHALKRRFLRNKPEITATAVRLCAEAIYTATDDVELVNGFADECRRAFPYKDMTMPGMMTTEASDFENPELESEIVDKEGKELENQRTYTEIMLPFIHAVRDKVRTERKIPISKDKALTKAVIRASL